MRLAPRHRAALEALQPGACDGGFEDFLEDFGRSAPPAMRLAFRAALEAACWLAPPLAGLRPPLWRLERGQAERALEALGASRRYLLRQQLVLLKTVLALHHGGRPETRRRLGFPG